MRIFQTVKEGQWSDIELKYIKYNIMFKIFDNDIPYIDSFGYSIFTSLSDAYLNDGGIWQIDIMDCVSE
jgi:hypothetical protein